MNKLEMFVAIIIIAFACSCKEQDRKTHNATIATEQKQRVTDTQLARMVDTVEKSHFEITKATILYDANNNSTLNLSIKNNMNVDVVAFEIFLSIHDSEAGPSKSRRCPGSYFRQKKIISAHKEIQLILPADDGGCGFEHAEVFVANAVLRNSKKIVQWEPGITSWRSRMRIAKTVEY